jgi:ubiquinone/menaquinone biosynthesis C-methylase UbiE
VVETGKNTPINANVLEPGRIVAGFGVRQGDHIADFGSGHGYFTLPLARAAGAGGRVYAIDVQESALDAIRSAAAFEHLLNIEYVRADLDIRGGSHLKDRFIDLVVMGNILFQAQDKDALLHEARRVLREDGRLAMIEWDASAVSPLGPPPAMRVKKDAARAAALQAGFEYDREFAAGTHHYGLLFVKR